MFIYSLFLPYTGHLLHPLKLSTLCYNHKLQFTVLGFTGIHRENVESLLNGGKLIKCNLISLKLQLQVF